MDRRRFLIRLGATPVAATMALIASLAIQAQQPAKAVRIGIIPMLNRSSGAPNVDAFKQGLRELGYTEGIDLVFDIRWSEANQDPSQNRDVFAAELVRLNVDVIVAGSGNSALSAKRATKTIPIVFAVAPDPVREGLVASLAHPGGNVTGLSYMSTELASKQLELLKSVMPRSPRVAVLWTRVIPAHPFLLKQLEDAAVKLKLAILPIEARRPEEIEGAFAQMTQERVGGILILPNSMWLMHGSRLDAFAAAHRLPTMYASVRQAERSGLLGYGADSRDLWKRAATYVDKILKGTKPADLPVEQPSKFELVVNLKTAKALKITVPPSLLQRADRVIE